MSRAEDGTGLELILNASEGILQIAVTENEKLQCYQEWHVPARASEILADALAEIFRRLKITARNFRRIACVAGPGSFTGIRLVLATAAALRRASRAQLASLDYMQALAATSVMNRGILYPAHLAVLTHARRNLAHFQRFCSYGPQIPPVLEGEARLVEPARALSELAGSHATVCGSALAKYPEIFALPITGQGPPQAPDLILLPDIVTPSVSALRLLARHGEFFPIDLEPKYTRGCDAVENLANDPASLPDLQKLNYLLAKKPESDI